MTEQRRPQDADLVPLLELIWEGKSLRGACLLMGLHTPATSDWLHADPGRSEQYTRAREGRAEFLQEDGLELTRAAANGEQIEGKPIDPAGVRVYLDAIKWSTARMAPKTAPIERRELTGKDGGAIPVRFESMTNAQLSSFLGRLDSEIDTREGAGGVGEETASDD